MNALAIYGLTTAMRLAATVDLNDPKVQEALKELYDDKATQRVMGPIYDKIRRGERAAGQNRLQRAAKGCARLMWHGGPFRFRKDPDTPELGISTRKIR